MVTNDPVESNPGLYKVLWENEFVRVLEYRDDPGTKSALHNHPDSVMITLSTFRRKLSVGDRIFETELPAGRALWLPAQRHAGENIGDSDTHAIFVELKQGHQDPEGQALGPGPVSNTAD